MNEQSTADPNVSVVVESMDNGRNVKCPRCWHWHGSVENFGHEPGAVLDGKRIAEKEKLCDPCQKVILENFPDHPSVPHIRLALEAQRKKYTAVTK